MIRLLIIPNDISDILGEDGYYNFLKKIKIKKHIPDDLPIWISVEFSPPIKDGKNQDDGKCEGEYGIHSKSLA